jgi:hypothetical protein
LPLVKTPLQAPVHSQINDYGGEHALRGEQGSESRLDLGGYPGTEGGRGGECILAADLLKVILLLLLLVFHHMLNY